jgi:hypothetical protein
VGYANRSGVSAGPLNIILAQKAIRGKSENRPGE